MPDHLTVSNLEMPPSGLVLAKALKTVIDSERRGWGVDHTGHTEFDMVLNIRIKPYDLIELLAHLFNQKYEMYEM